MGIVEKDSMLLLLCWFSSTPVQQLDEFSNWMNMLDKIPIPVYRVSHTQKREHSIFIALIFENIPYIDFIIENIVF